MSRLLESSKPYGPRRDADFLSEMNDLTQTHLRGCPEYARIWPDFKEARTVAELPWLHVGLFKRIAFRTQGDEIRHERTLSSSATSSGVPSQIALDQGSSQLQATSTRAILQDFVGDRLRPLLVLDSSRSLRSPGGISARIAAALSLRPLSSEIHFLLEDAEDPRSLKWETLARQLEASDELLVYGFTWILWLAWGQAEMPSEIRTALAGKRIDFVHSGGWKKLEALKVDPDMLNRKLTTGLHPDSRVVDFYGLVEQVGVIYPLCEAGYRHPPVWADVLVRDSWTLEPLVDTTGQLQLMNTLARGAPYHNVLTEDLGRIVPGDCSCSRSGTRFELIGRVPKAEVRGCANV
jgi:hypothetical protein